MLHPESIFSSHAAPLAVDDRRPARRTGGNGEAEPSEQPCDKWALVLLEDDDPALLGALAEALERRGYASRTTSSAGAARAALHRVPPDLLLLDAAIAREDDEMVRQLRRGDPEVKIVIIDSDDVPGPRHRGGNGNGHADHSVLHLSRPIDFDAFDRLLRNGRSNGHATHDNPTGDGRPTTEGQRPRRPSRHTTPLPERAPLHGCGNIVGESDEMRATYDMIARVAPTDATVFVAGESGTGKELVAQAIHQQSPRAHRPFVAVNCGAIPDGLIDSELFGHEKGAFTGASRSRGGVFEQAHGGTLFLDEITEMPIDLQARLLRVLETGRVRRVGSDRDTPVEVRVVTASNRPAQQALEHGRLREDLLYRLSVFPIQLPPLRDRGEDAILLANHFLAELNDSVETPRRFSAAALEIIRGYHWPGNVRQLKHAIHRAFILADEVIEPRYLPAQIKQRPAEADGKLQLPVGTSIAEAERQLIHATLDHYGGDKKKAADVLGMSLRTLYNRLNVYKAQEREARGRGRRKDAASPNGGDHLFA